MYKAAIVNNIHYAGAGLNFGLRSTVVKMTDIKVGFGLVLLVPVSNQSEIKLDGREIINYEWSYNEYDHLRDYISV